MYFVQLINGKWEEVDKLIYDKFKFVFLRDDTRRYTDNRFEVNDAGADWTHLTTVSKADMAIITKLCGVQPIMGHVPGQGFAPKPVENLKIRQGNSCKFYEMSTGDMFRREPKKVKQQQSEVATKAA